MEKQFLVVKIASEMGAALSMLPLPGLFDRAGAEQALSEMRAADPESVFVIQEVGAA